MKIGEAVQYAGAEQTVRQRRDTAVATTKSKGSERVLQRRGFSTETHVQVVWKRAAAEIVERARTRREIRTRETRGARMASR